MPSRPPLFTPETAAREARPAEAAGLIRRGEASINDVPIKAAGRRFLWPAGPRPSALRPPRD